jgi:phosphoglycolate phosphatase-like HAD superfamily hydrolase
VFWLDHILRESQTAVCAGVREFIQGLQALAPPPLLGLLTGNIRLGAEIKLRHFRLWDVFATGAFADDHEERSQIAAIARGRGAKLLKEDLKDDQVLVIGDTPLDIACARAINAKVLAVATGGASLEELQRHQPDWAVADLRAVTPKEVISEGRAPARP